MKISDPNGIPQSTANPQRIETNQSAVSKDRVSSQSRAIDQVTLSGQRRKHQRIQEAIKQIPEIRQKHIEKISAALEAGKYHISSKHVAEHIIQDTLLNHTRKRN